MTMWHIDCRRCGIKHPVLDPHASSSDICEAHADTLRRERVARNCKAIAELFYGLAETIAATPRQILADEKEWQDNG